MTMFSAYLYYLYKFNLNVCAAQVTLDIRYSRKLFRIATALLTARITCSSNSMIKKNNIIVLALVRWRIYFTLVFVHMKFSCPSKHIL